MAVIGNSPATNFQAIKKQSITGDGDSAYTLDYSVTHANDLEVFVNNVRQEPIVAYTASDQTITFSEGIDSTDDVYMIYKAQTFGNAVPADNTITDEMLRAASVTSSKISTDAITADKLIDNAVTSDKLHDSFQSGSIIRPADSDRLFIGTSPGNSGFNPGGTATLNILGDSSTQGTIRMGTKKSVGNGNNFSHIHYGSTADWYIRPGHNTGKIVIGDGHSDQKISLGTSSTDTNAKITVDGNINMSSPSGVYTNIMENGTSGFYGDFGFGPIFRTPDLNAGSSGESTSDFMDLYQSGHWGQGHSIFVYVINRYYGAGYRKYHIRYDRGATNPTINALEEYGGEMGQYIDYHNSTTIGSNGHSGQQVRRTTIRLRTGGAYYNCFAWIQLIRTTDGNYCHDNASTQSNVATQRSSAGGTVHFRTFAINHAGAVYPRRRTA